MPNEYDPDYHKFVNHWSKGPNILSSARYFRKVAAIGFTMTLLACSESDPSRGLIHDPYESANRKMHETNKAIDTAILRPTAGLYAQAVPAGVRTMVGNFSGNLSEPRYAVNNLLQGDIPGFIGSVGRFALNSTLGIGGLADPAAELGLYPDPANFGQTMGSWGVSEGAYVELPLLGPSSERDTAGRIVDLIFDPVNTFARKPETNIFTAAKTLDVLGTRHDFDAAVNSVLYESEDSYALARLLYLQSVRGATGGATALEDLEDPYAE